MSDLAPIVLFVYNRPAHARQTITSLQKNILASESELFIYSDAAKTSKDVTSVVLVREYIKSITGFRSVSIIEQSENCGLAQSIISGVTNIISRYGKVIVLEDDLMTSPYFLTFMNDALDYYRDNKRVWHISGYTAPLNIQIEEHYFIKPTTCWGWATWNDRWCFFKKDSSYFIEKFTKEMIADFNLDNSYNYFSHLLLNHKKKINTWAIFWYLTCYENNGLSLHPRQSFVNNIGHDNSGVNCTANDKYDVQLACTYYDVFPDSVVENRNVVIELQQYYKNIEPPLSKKIVNKLMKIKKKYIG